MEAVALALLGEEYDVDGTRQRAFDRSVGPQLAVFGCQPRKPGRLQLDDCNLTTARLVLSKYWDYFEQKEFHRGKPLAKGAAAAINRTAKALKACGAWEGKCEFRAVAEQIEQRMVNTRGAASKNGDELDIQFGKLGFNG
jgi:hypothetical protein